MGCDQCQNALCQKTVHTSHSPVYSLKLGVCVLTCWKQVVCIAEMGGMYQLQKWGNVGYVSVAEMGVCVVEMWGMYQLQKWGVCIAETGVCVFLENILECEQYAQFSDIVNFDTDHTP